MEEARSARRLSGGAAKRNACSLVGMKHSGKTTVGRRVAELGGFAFFDLDTLIQDCYAERHRRRCTATVREIYRTAGKSGFREFERLAVERLATVLDASGTPAVVACGGGVVENDAAMRQLVSLCVVVYLDEDPTVLFERVLAGGVPAFLEGPDPRREFAELRRRRDPLYRRYADRVVAVRKRAPEEVARQVYTVMQELLDARK